MWEVRKEQGEAKGMTGLAGGLGGLQGRKRGVPCVGGLYPPLAACSPRARWTHGPEPPTPLQPFLCFPFIHLPDLLAILHLTPPSIFTVHSSACLEQRIQAHGEVRVVDVFASKGREQGIQRVVHLAKKQ